MNPYNTHAQIHPVFFSLVQHHQDTLITGYNPKVLWWVRERKIFMYAFGSSLKSSNDLIVVWLHNYLCLTAEEGQVFQVNDVWEYYVMLAKQSPTDILTSSVLKRKSSTSSW
ncbi:UNVERIFIED_CONTAM: hypothetical protein K2H54_033787 [Gekko kuhli]